jgi:predicted porin
MGTPGFGNVFQTGSAASGNPAGCVNANGGVSCTDFYYRESQSIWYNSPNFNGFTFGVYTTLPAYKVNANPTTGTSGINPVDWGLGGKYVGTSLPIQVWAAYEDHRDSFGMAAINPAGGWNGNGAGGEGTSSSDKGYQLGGGYTFGDVFLFLIFERLDYKTNGTFAAFGGAAGQIQYRRNAFDLGAKWNIATGYVGGQFIKASSGNCTIPGQGCSGSNTGGYMLGLGYYHTLSKQTQAYVMATFNHNDDLQYYTTAGGVGAPLSYGSSLWGLNVGLKHSF